MNVMHLLGAIALGAFLVSCAAIERENNSPTPIPPARPNPMGDSFGNSSPSPVNIGPAPTGL